jgi:hypothetical protein
MGSRGGDTRGPRCGFSMMHLPTEQLPMVAAGTAAQLLGIAVPH